MTNQSQNISLVLDKNEANFMINKILQTASEVLISSISAPDGYIAFIFFMFLIHPVATPCASLAVETLMPWYLWLQLDTPLMLLTSKP